MTAEIGSEPTGWELLRGLGEVKGAIDKLGGKVVSTELYAADKKAAEARNLAQDEKIAALQHAQLSVEENRKESEKLKRSQRLAIALGISSPVIAFLFGVLNRLIFP